MQCDTIKELLETNLANAQVEVVGDGRHFEAKIIYDGFAGKSRLQRQQLIYQILNPHILSGAIHAISLKTLTSEEKDLA